MFCTFGKVAIVTMSKFCKIYSWNFLDKYGSTRRICFTISFEFVSREREWSRKFQESFLQNFDMVTIAILANMQNTSMWHIPFHFQKCIQNVSKTQNQGYGELLHFTSFPSIPCSYFSEIYNCSN